MNSTDNFICVDYIHGLCDKPCGNFHIDNLDTARTEYFSKKNTRICYNYNFNHQGCKYSPCRFLHVIIPSKNKDLRNFKVERALSALKTNLIRLEKLKDEVLAKQIIGPRAEYIELAYKRVYEELYTFTKEVEHVVQ